MNDNDYLRFGGAKVLSRPNMRDKAANTVESSKWSNTVWTTGGDPNLKPYEVNQFDLSYEHYGEHRSYSVGYFYKDISNFISNFQTLGMWDCESEQALLDTYEAAGITEGITTDSNRPTNLAGGTVEGLEFAYMHTFDYLTGFGVVLVYRQTIPGLIVKIKIRSQWIALALLNQTMP